MASMQKLGQMAPWWLNMARWVPAVAGATAGGAGGYLAHNKLTGKDGTWYGSLGSTLAGAGLGAAAGGAHIPWSPQMLESIHDFGRSGFLPVMGGVAGAAYGGYKGNQQNQESPWASGLLGAGLGGLLGATAGRGLGSGMSQLSLNAARNLALDEYGHGIARDWARDMRGRGFWTDRVTRMIDNDPYNLVGQGLVQNQLRNMRPQDLFTALRNTDPAAALTTQFYGGQPTRWANNAAEALNLGRGLGVAPSAAENIFGNVTDLVGPDAASYLRGAGYLGGGYLGLSALGNLYQKFQNPQRRDNRGVIVL
jgi:hypothetical protein